MKMVNKESKCGCTYITQNRLQNRNCPKRQKGNYIIIKGSIHQEDVTTVNIYAPTLQH